MHLPATVNAHAHLNHFSQCLSVSVRPSQASSPRCPYRAPPPPLITLKTLRAFNHLYHSQPVTAMCWNSCRFVARLCRVGVEFGGRQPSPPPCRAPVGVCGGLHSAPRLGAEGVFAVAHSPALGLSAKRCRENGGRVGTPGPGRPVTDRSPLTHACTAGRGRGRCACIRAARVEALATKRPRPRPRACRGAARDPLPP